MQEVQQEYLFLYTIIAIIMKSDRIWHPPSKFVWRFLKNQKKLLLLPKEAAFGVYFFWFC